MRSCYHDIKPQINLPKVGDECDKRGVISFSVKEMLEKQERKSGFFNSGHFRSFTITEVNFLKDGIDFREAQPKNIVIDSELNKVNLFSQHNS